MAASKHILWHLQTTLPDNISAISFSKGCWQLNVQNLIQLLVLNTYMLYVQVCHQHTLYWEAVTLSEMRVSSMLIGSKLLAIRWRSRNTLELVMTI